MIFEDGGGCSKRPVAVTGSHVMADADRLEMTRRRSCR
jgi:hypothetical protein